MKSSFMKPDTAGKIELSSDDMPRDQLWKSLKIRVKGEFAQVSHNIQESQNTSDHSFIVSTNATAKNPFMPATDWWSLRFLSCPSIRRDALQSASLSVAAQ